MKTEMSTQSTTPIPTGRYSITLAGHPTLVKLTRVTAPRRWTTVSVSSPLTPDEWAEVHLPQLRAAILKELRNVDLETASALYTARTGVCGVCGWPAATDHNGCMARKFDTTTVTTFSPARSLLCP